MKLARCLALAAALAASALTGCAADPGSEDSTGETGEASSDTATALAQSEMKPYATPAGLPKPWEQPDSTGLFEERGKCGPTAVANTLKLYAIDFSPIQADEAGVHSLVGTTALEIEAYLAMHHWDLDCSIQHPKNGPTFLRDNLSQGHPVMLVFMTGANMGSHWVTAVGTVGQGANEQVIVMSWGRYYAIPMQKLEAAWRNVYGLRRPSVVCTKPTTLVRH